MENINSSISISLRDGNITISGSDTFVEKNMQAAFDFVESNLALFPTTPPATPVTHLSTDLPINGTTTDYSAAGQKSVSDAESDKYIEAGIYHIDPDDGTISILKKIPGNNKSEKTKNIALIVLYIKKGKVPGKDIIPICVKHACYDCSNFSSIFKNEKTNIIRKGTGQNWTIELTQPGETAAINLLEEMVKDTK